MAEPGRDVASETSDEERERRDHLAEALDRRIRDIERRWLEKVQQEVASSGHRFTPTELRDAIGEYLERLADGLRGERTVENSGDAAWSDVAREHALARVRLGFDIEQLVREFILLRRTMVDVAREEGLITNDRQGDRLADMVDAAIATSVKSYIESRDLAMRRTQAEHVGFLTHELRNPLSTAVMSAGRLRRRQDFTDAERDTLDTLDRSLERIRGLIDDTLLTQRLEAREMESRPVDMSVGQLMGDAVKAAALEADRKGIVLNVQYDPEVAIYVDPGLSLSALQNVVDNAVKFTDRGHVDVMVEDRPADVLIHVYDNCEGLSPEELRTIFEPFKRAHPRKPGTGLGLAIARRAIEAQGGEISADSGGERGCHFWLTLPKPRH
jgi:signal transduction histidine kinase